MNCLDLVVSLSNQKCRFPRPEQLQDPYIVDLKCSKFQKCQLCNSKNIVGTEQPQSKTIIVPWLTREARDLGLVYTISDYLSCRIIFMNPVRKMLQSVNVYTKSSTQLWEQSVSGPSGAV